MEYSMIILFSGNTVTLINRKYVPEQGLWCGVGGLKEEYETMDECAIRELREETGVFLPTLIHVVDMPKINSAIYTGYGRPFSRAGHVAMISKEGIIHNVPISWAIDSANKGVTNETKEAIKESLKALAK